MPTRNDFRRRDRFAGLVLLALIIALGGALVLRRTVFDVDDRPIERIGPAHEAIVFDRFSARRERSAEGDRLSVSLRMRTTMNVSLPSFVFLVARNDQVVPKQWAIWPPQGPGPAISASGHFHGATPTAGYAVVLSDQWEHIDATMPQPTGSVQFDIVVVYVVDADGRILLTRPFRI
jgi:hypothetical protein